MSEELFGYLNSSELYAWTEAQPSDAYMKNQFKSGYSASDVENTSNTKEQLKLCALCNLVPYYPISTRCGHVYCPPCVWREFNESNQSNTSSDIKITCNACNEPLHICDLRAGLNEAIAVLYNLAEVACKNLGCSRNLTLGTLAKHEFLNCPNRIIRCPAEACKYKATPAQVNEHVRSCVYVKYVCITCRTAFSIAITDHDCTVLLRRHLQEYESGAKPKLEQAICTASYINKSIKMIANGTYEDEAEKMIKILELLCS